MKDTDVKHGHEKVRDDSYTVSFPLFGLRGRPVQRVQDVLTEGGEEAVGHLPEESQIRYQFINNSRRVVHFLLNSPCCYYFVGSCFCFGLFWDLIRTFHLHVTQFSKVKITLHNNKYYFMSTSFSNIFAALSLIKYCRWSFCN